ncbi:MAG: hypothetical protein GXO55_05615 [Chloroflexi bacterium]|nr:hypothetical protein [Chloroflexota bacterium]
MKRLGVLWSAALVGMAVLFAGLWVIALSGRVFYPFELEWQEGAMVVHVLRVRAGTPLYVPPSPSFIPFIYPPLYMYAAAGLSRLLGTGFLPLRALSVGSTVAVAALLGSWVYRETRRPAAAGATVALWLATYPLSGTWFDVGRVDAFFLLWVWMAAWLLRFGEGPAAYVGASLAWTLAFFTKQTALFVLAPLYAWLFLSRRVRAWPFLVGFPLLLGLGVGAAYRMTGGWFAYYVFRLPAGHALLPHMVTRFWWHDLLPHLGGALVLTLVAVLWGRGGWEKGFYAALLVGLVGSAWFSRIHEGGYLNVLMPAHSGLALGTGLLAGRLTFRGRWKGAHGLAAGVVLLQLMWLLYNPLPLRPPARNVAAGRALLEVLVHIRGDVLIPYHGYLAEMAGKRSFAHEMAMSDVLRGDPDGWGRRLEAMYRKDILSARWSAIVLDREDWRYIEEVRRVYEGPVRVFHDDRVFWPVTGFRTRPEYLYLGGQGMVMGRY